ncbi:aspartate dehydrogenase [Mycobacterium stomatepiae]|uniref:L-aspartate dehydrogenase n=2 Tax=Mycobacterium stomatepiae TaxID=470076 RepID=A0A7I7QFA6_9MYCO|nr:aspartate dehydrogenase [Mycobacterium stomatepiae]MCV7167293.1 aspartate dehydrogenase [Mycobacterium stomatepiae]BBY24636.1 putative L-aspartate dehydrogenase [Mycobacterium stomatepiae]
MTASVTTPNPLRVGIVGLGPVGSVVARAIDKGIAGYRLSAISARRTKLAEDFSRTLTSPVPVVDADQIEPCSDLVIECAPASLFTTIATPTIEAGKRLVVLSSSALLEHWSLVERAHQTGAVISVPSGAIAGLDAVQAAAHGTIFEVTMTTRKPIASLIGAPYLRGRDDELRSLREPMLLFEGNARQAATGFPANLNVAVALSLAGIGPDKTTLRVWADPTVDRNTHIVDMRSDSADLHIRIANIPTENPKTGRITAQSVVAHLAKTAATLRLAT